MSRHQQALLLLVAAVTAASWIRAPYPDEMLLQHIPTVLVLLGWPLLARRFPLSDAAATCLVAFLLLHVLGARYLYSNVPYDVWARALFGGDLSSWLGGRRNHYDRLVHFAFGLLWLRPLREIGVRYLRLSPRYAGFAAVEFVLAWSALYEVFEWGLTMVLSPEDADSYNGQQGDMWDAQKDMALAFLGAVVALGILALSRSARLGYHAAPAALADRTTAHAKEPRP